MLNTTIAYLRKDGFTLMLYRDRENDIHKGKYVGLGGKFEPFETPDECMKREVFEESNLEVKDYEIRGRIKFIGFKEEEIMMYVYEVTSFIGEIEESNEGKLEWIKDSKINELNIWQGDKVFHKWLYETKDFFDAIFYYKDGEYISHEVTFI